MRKLTCIIALMFVAFIARSQNSPGQEEVFTPDPNMPEYKQGEILVKFRDEVNISMLKAGGVMQTGLSSVDALNEKWGISGMKRVIRNAQKQATTQMITMPDGKQIKLAQMFNIYKLSFPESRDAKQVVEDFKALPEVEYAELNRVFFMTGAIPASEPFIMPGSDQTKSTTGGNPRSPALITPNDPMYGQQWYIPNVKADSLWSYTTGDTLQVIGILDTGVDWLHPDLVNKIWRNTDEIPNNGIDDDNNGFIDDTRGWDFVNDDNNPMDDNSHGTHCAGIAAAETNNGIGIAGMSWGAKIMPVKIMQSAGFSYGDQIAEGIWYAAQNGSTVSSNSWGGNGESITVRLALEYAYSKGPIIASAANEGHKLDWPFPPWPPTAPVFPACYNWILGVEATVPNGWNAWFSNYDPTGPVISDGRPYGLIFFNDNEYNYEVRAPGVSILSTVPNGQYRWYNGTSMSCPLVSGAVALMKSYDSTLTNEEVFAKLIQLNKINMFQAGVMNILKSTLNDPPPDIYYQSYSIADSAGDKDGKADAGETINLFIKIKNAGGIVNPVWARIRLGEFEDTTAVDFVMDSCYFGSVGTYGKKTSSTPFTLSINPNLADNRYVSLRVMVIYNVNNIPDTAFQNIGITVEHGLEIKGFYSSLHLRPSYYYIVTEPSAIDTLIIDPGVTLRFKSNTYLGVSAKLTAIGKPDSMIIFKGAGGMYWRGITIVPTCDNTFSYCIFEDGWNYYGGGNLLTNPSKIYHSIFRNNQTIIYGTKNGGDYRYNVFTNNKPDPYGHRTMLEYWNLCDFKFNIVSNNECGNSYWGKSAALQFYNTPYPENMNRTEFNVFMNNTGTYNSYDIGHVSWNGLPLGTYYIDSNYYGTTKLSVIREHILDYYEDPLLPILEPRNNLTKPPSQCHGVVWKVLINGQNPQDVNNPIIVSGTVKFDVYFNRPMDVSVAPFVTFGVRYPFTQNVVNVNTSWSTDSTIWTGYCTVTLQSGDGDNTVRVAFAKDTDHFEIPIEDERFKFVVQVAGSQSIDFNAFPGVGKVSLIWDKNDSLSTLGYNMYRYTMINDSTYSDTVIINSILITDTTFIDYDVLPGVNYHYLYSILGTDLHETDYSKVVTAAPIAAANGDANGDAVVNVLDVTTLIAYMLNQNPQPFLFDAADINNDNTINVLDIVGVVNVILGKKKSASSAISSHPDPAYIYLDENRIRFRSKGQVSALQFELTGENLGDVQLTCDQRGFELATGIVKGKLMGILYNMQNRPLPDGMIELVVLQGNKTKLGWGDVTAGDQTGQYVYVYKDAPETGLPSNGEQLQAFPNPFNETVTLTYKLTETSTIKLTVHDLSGHQVKLLEAKENRAGAHQIQWNGKSDDGNVLPSGIYVCRLEGTTIKNKRIESEVKIIIEK